MPTPNDLYFMFREGGTLETSGSGDHHTLHPANEYVAMAMERGQPSEPGQVNPSGSGFRCLLLCIEGVLGFQGPSPGPLDWVNLTRVLISAAEVLGARAKAEGHETTARHWSLIAAPELPPGAPPMDGVTPEAFLGRLLEGGIGGGEDLAILGRYLNVLMELLASVATGTHFDSSMDNNKDNALTVFALMLVSFAFGCPVECMYEGSLYFTLNLSSHNMGGQATGSVFRVNYHPSRRHFTYMGVDVFTGMDRELVWERYCALTEELRVTASHPTPALKPRMATVNGNAIQWQIAPVYSSEGDPKFGPTFSHNKKKSLVFFLVFTDLPQLWSLFKF